MIKNDRYYHIVVKFTSTYAVNQYMYFVNPLYWNCLKISKWQSEAVNRRTDNTMTKRKRTTWLIKVDKTLKNDQIGIELGCSGRISRSRSTSGPVQDCHWRSEYRMISAGALVTSTYPKRTDKVWKWHYTLIWNVNIFLFLIFDFFIIL